MLASATESYRTAYARGLMPDPDYMLSEWAAKKRVVPPETSSFPGRWKNELVPYLVEIMDCLSPADPADRVALMKSAQIAGSEAATNFILYIADIAPGPTMVVHPTVEAGKSWGREKLNPNIEENPDMRRIFVENKGREGGSTALYKKFPGGFLVITGANSAAALRQKSIRYLIKDDWDEWPLDVNGQGDPDKMANARQISFHASGTAKCFEVSTPTTRSISRITRSYEESDQRVFEVPCPQCGHEQELRFFPVSAEPFRGGLKFNKKPPFEAYYVCEKNGCIIEHHEKRGMLAKGRWRKKNPGPGRHPGFKINAIYSPFTSWDKMAGAFLDAKGKPLELKTFWNLWLGEPWEERGDAPDWKRLLTLREDYPLGRIPVGAILLTTAVDVQKDGFYFEVVGWGVGKTSWVVDKGFIPGDTARAESWAGVDALYNRWYENAWGQAFQTDMMAVDSGYHAHMVYAWARNKHKAMAVKGAHGAQAPLLGTPSKQDVAYSGQRKLRRGLRVWPVGGWQGKSEFYAMLRLEGVAEGRDEDPWGYCHFSTGCDEAYFKQLTSESLVTHTRGGRSVTEWVVSGENHYLDCRIYNLACAERLGLSRMTIADWERWAALRNVPKDSLQGDLLALAERMATRPAKAAESAADQGDAAIEPGGDDCAAGGEDSGAGDTGIDDSGLDDSDGGVSLAQPPRPAPPEPVHPGPQGPNPPGRPRPGKKNRVVARMF